MKRYLVGGAVRDALLGVPTGDRDWVVVGATQQDMEAEGYRAVGRDFPVFLHPETGEEHALARTERKSGRGYRGFVVDASPDVTLEEDLRRRDLTVNAMARDEHGALIDPYGGQQDLEARLLRHVSEAFTEDPLRVLRVARFASRFAPLGFRVADETMALMRGISASGELEALASERVWKETERALMQPRPAVYFETLRAAGALAVLMPEVDRLFGVPQRPDYHPEVDSGIHLMMALDAAADHGFGLPVRVAVLLHDLGKGVTPPEILPGHSGHEARGVPLVEAFCERLRVPKALRALAVVVCREHLRVHRAPRLRPGTLLELLEVLRAFRDEAFFEDALAACLSDARGREGLGDCAYPSVAYLRGARQAAQAVTARDAMATGAQGAEVSATLTRLRERALADFRAASSKG